MSVDAPLKPRFDLGQRLRQLRLELGLSQRELSRRAGMTNANLSMIEQGRVSPSIQTLEKILRAVPISLSDFFRSGDPAAPVVLTRAEQARLKQQGGELFIATKPALDCQPVVIRCYLKPGASISESPAIPKNSWLAGLVIRGHLTLTLDNDLWTLTEEDAFQFYQNRSFRLENRDCEDLYLTLVVTPAIAEAGSKV
jgi:transcriptional regulator with XRE-family HTH domain